jgi:hypothetical protein
MYKTMHNIYIVGAAWGRIQEAEDQQTCAICNTEDSMEHILTECNSLSRREVWSLARQTWPHASKLWPNISLGTILGTGCLSLPREHHVRNNVNQNPNPTQEDRATLRLLQIIISEAAHLAWVLRCEHVIRGTNLNKQGIKNRWHRAINEWLTTDWITAYKTKRDKKFTKLTELTWKKLLTRNGTLPENWFQNCEVLVGIRTWPTGNQEHVLSPTLPQHHGVCINTFSPPPGLSWATAR